MTTEQFDGLDWEIDDFPIGCSTPDEFFETSYRATATCECGNEISGVAQYWSRDPDGISSWLERIDYEPCDCEEEIDDEDDF